MSEQRKMTWDELAVECARLRAANKALREAVEEIAVAPRCDSDATQWTPWQRGYREGLLEAASIARAALAKAGEP